MHLVEDISELDSQQEQAEQVGSIGLVIYFLQIPLALTCCIDLLYNVLHKSLYNKSTKHRSICSSNFTFRCGTRGKFGMSGFFEDT